MSNWQRVSSSRPCPICGKPDWCLYVGPSYAPEAVICARRASDNRCGESGWLHRLRDNTAWRRSERTIRTIQPGRPPSGALAAMAKEWRLPMDSPALARFADSLGLSDLNLHRLHVGWSPRHGAWSFPMRDASGSVAGIRLRLPSGRKFSVTGSREGLFLLKELAAGGRLLVCEGPTDTAALLDLGFPAVGRPSCTGGLRHLVDLVRRLAVPEVVIVADADEPGQRGAESLAAVLVAYCTAVKIVTPPAGLKDARQWKRAGATAVDVQAAIDAAPVRRLSIQVRKAGDRYE